MVSGLFFAILVMRHGVEKFRSTLINREGNDIVIGRWFNTAIRLVAIQAIVITAWWLWQAVNLEDLRATFTLISEFNVGTVLIQWSIAITAFVGLNRWLAFHAAGNTSSDT